MWIELENGNLVNTAVVGMIETVFWGEKDHRITCHLQDGTGPELLKHPDERVRDHVFRALKRALNDGNEHTFRIVEYVNTAETHFKNENKPVEDPDGYR